MVIRSELLNYYIFSIILSMYIKQLFYCYSMMEFLGLGHTY